MWGNTYGHLYIYVHMRQRTSIYDEDVKNFSQHGSAQAWVQG